MRVEKPKPLPQLRLDQLGSSRGTSDQLRRTAQGMSGDTKDALKGVDLTRVRPTQLGPIVVRLLDEKKLTEDAAACIMVLRDRYPNKLYDDKPFNLIERIESVARAAQGLGSRYPPGNQAQLYREAVYTAKGLQQIVKGLRSGKLLDVAA